MLQSVDFDPTADIISSTSLLPGGMFNPKADIPYAYGLRPASAQTQHNCYTGSSKTIELREARGGALSRFHDVAAAEKHGVCKDTFSDGDHFVVLAVC